MDVTQTLAEMTADLIAIAAPWPTVAAGIAVILPTVLGLWLVARLTSNPLAVRSGNPPPGGPAPPGRSTDGQSPHTPVGG